MRFISIIGQISLCSEERLRFSIHRQVLIKKILLSKLKLKLSAATSESADSEASSTASVELNNRC
jgi:hypothetical protein